MKEIEEMKYENERAKKNKRYDGILKALKCGIFYSSP